eukprot:12396916-Alexandrium_andersonii.AAC.1
MNIACPPSHPGVRMWRTRQREERAGADAFCISARQQALQSSVPAYCGALHASQGHQASEPRR